MRQFANFYICIGKYAFREKSEFRAEMEDFDGGKKSSRRTPRDTVVSKKCIQTYFSVYVIQSLCDRNSIEVKTYRLSSSWLCANAWATRSKRNERAVSGDAAPPELESPPVDDMPCNSSRDISAESAGKLSYMFYFIFSLMLKMD